MPELYSYIIDHKGQPCIADSNLVLDKCKPRPNTKKMRGIRYGAKKDDWVIATLGKNYDKKYHDGSFFSKHGENARFFLVYAMKITKKPSDIKTKTKALTSDYFFIPSEPVCLPEKFHKMVSLCRQHKHLTSKTDGEMIRSFDKWIEEQRNAIKSESKNSSWLCKKSTICV